MWVVCIREKKLNRKKQQQKNKSCFTTLRTDSRCMRMKSVLYLSWQRSLLYRNQSIDLQNKSVGWLLYGKNLRHERVNTLLLACIHDKIIEIYASKYQRRMPLVNPLSKTHKAYIDFGIFSLYFIVVICKNFRFASNN